ncbi:hypothetical protein C9374_001484 [Naegleria lovaniensis]|uniref:Uncharacterized protein n=1 Tax=Naegleria lovaniensis TaxID=51637 RepID=A0AA88GU99_NAELO|nr:uncharacterized protein C9374_001484 [Naegleria lovaniensis]KAG2387152.1 hypothetical protein C9374_001484 [Naegleria lovaniensis]
MSLLSRDLQAKASFNLQSLEAIEGQKGYGVIDNTNGTVIHSEGILKNQPELLTHIYFILQDVNGLLTSSNSGETMKKLQIKFNDQNSPPTTYHIALSKSSTFVVLTQ